MSSKRERHERRERRVAVGQRWREKSTGILWQVEDDLGPAKAGWQLLRWGGDEVREVGFKVLESAYDLDTLSAAELEAIEAAELGEAPGEPLGEPVEPVEVFVRLVQVPGRGWSRQIVALPSSVAQRFTVKYSEPDLLGIAMGQLINSIEREAAGR